MVIIEGTGPFLLKDPDGKVYAEVQDKERAFKLVELLNETAVDKARDAFETVVGADGDGLVVTDEDLVADYIARIYDVDPAQVYDEYGE